MLWPFLGSALLVGIMVTGDVIRAYSWQRLRATAHRTGAFGVARSTDEPHNLQRARAAEPGRGRHAQAPWHIPWKGWKDKIGEDRLLAVAAGVVFYGLLAVFPAITALLFIRAVRKSGSDQRSTRASQRNSSGQCC
jgi:hypothetical protein